MERIVNSVTHALEDAGLHVVRGYSGRQLPVLDSPIVSVSLADIHYTPLCADGLISQDAATKAIGLYATANLLLEVYDDYRHGDLACVQTASSAACICSAMHDIFTCGHILLSCVHYEPDYDCFLCSVKIPISLYVAACNPL
ncbi:MAG: hypothetical protein IJB35_02170 [Oscillospiraceae bacterium]|nr:hypothetical protein [Oscillospiraceae bacterium]